MARGDESPDLTGRLRGLLPVAPATARGNLVLLAAGMAALYGMIQLAFGAAKLTITESGGPGSLAGLAPALFLGCGALAALPAGRAMDRSGPRRVLMMGFAAGLTGGLITALGVATSTFALVLVGFAIAGVATGTVLLSRAAAAAMFAPRQRPKAIAFVLFGAVFGALLGPLVFGPLLEDEGGGSALGFAWLGAAGFMLAGLLVASRLKPAKGDGTGVGAILPEGAKPDRLRQAVSRPGVAPAIFAVVASLASMVGIMALVGTALVDHGHEHGAVFPVLSAHFIGMFGFFAIVGRVVERIGRPGAMVSGLLLIALSATALLAAIEAIHWAAIALLGIGLGWSLSLVAATAELSERAREGESATLIGFSDLLGGLSGAALVAAGGFALDSIGLIAVTSAATALPLFAAAWIAVATRPGALAAAEAAAD